METLARAANRGSISTGFDIDNSIKMEADNTEYLSWSNMSSYATDARKRTWSISFWCKRTEIGPQQLPWNSGGNGYLAFQAADHLSFQQFFSDSAGAAKYLNTNRLFRDPSAWYHIIIAIDTTQSTEAHRMRLYVNGEEETSFASTVYPPQNATATDIYGSYISLGRSLNWGAGFSGYIANYYLISEVQLVPTDVGEYDEDSGIWKPKAYAGAITAPSTFLEFKDSSNFKTATSGLDATVSSNLTAADQATDTPTNNFCTYNNNWKTATGTAATEGGTTVTTASGAGWLSIVGTFGLTSGKWYWEAASSGAYVFYGIADVESATIPQATGGYYLGYGDDNSTKSIGMYGYNGVIYSETGGNGGGPGADANWVVQIALDMDNKCIYFGANGSYMAGADPTSGANKTAASTWADDWTDTVYPALSVGATYNTTANFGGYTADVISSAASDANGYGTFEYAPPSGYYAICTKNLAEFG